MKAMNRCEKCVWYVWRELTPDESLWAKRNPGYIVDTRFCALGGCDGKMFLGFSGTEECMEVSN